MNDWDNKYLELSKELYEIFLIKSKQYNYSFFNSTPVEAYFELKRKFDRISSIIGVQKVNGKIDANTLKLMHEEALDLANYALMYRMLLEKAKE